MFNIRYIEPVRLTMPSLAGDWSQPRICGYHAHCAICARNRFKATNNDVKILSGTLDKDSDEDD